MPLLQYALQFSVALTLFYSLYLLAFKNETYFKAIRIYLLAGICLAGLLPFFPIELVSTLNIVENSEFFALSDSRLSQEVVQIENLKLSSSWTISEIFLAILLSGTIALLGLLLLHSILILQKAHRKKIEKIDGVKVVDQAGSTPYSFFNFIFIDKQKYSTRELSNIIAHEKIHIQQRHWIDLLLIELITVLFWFNPVVWLYRKAIKQNHEYLADQGVLLAGYHPGQYQAILINQLMGVKVLGFAHNLNFSLNKKRMEMMKKEKSPTRNKFRFLVILPIIGLLMFAFAKPKYVIMTNQNTAETIQNMEYKGELITVHGRVLDENQNPMPGANVILKNSTEGTVVDLDGTFKIDMPKDGKLVVSFVGYKSIVTEMSNSHINGKNGKISLQMEKKSWNIKLPEVPDQEIVDLPPPNPTPTPKAKDGEEVFVMVEEMPFYANGGMHQLAFDLQKQITMVMDKTQDRGEVLVGFTVSKKGQVQNPQVLESSKSQMLDASAIKIINKLNSWKPGKQRGKPVDVDLTVPVSFN